MPNSTPTPFHVFFPHTEIDRMMTKVRDTRLAPRPILPDPKLGWSYGLDHAWFAELKKYWDEEWDWEVVQKDINRCVPVRARTRGGGKGRGEGQAKMETGTRWKRKTLDRERIVSAPSVGRVSIIERGWSCELVRKSAVVLVVWVDFLMVVVLLL